MSRVEQRLEIVPELKQVLEPKYGNANVTPIAQILDWVDQLVMSGMKQEERLEIAGNLRQALVSGISIELSSPVLV